MNLILGAAREVPCQGDFGGNITVLPMLLGDFLAKVEGLNKIHILIVCVEECSIHICLKYYVAN